MPVYKALILNKEISINYQENEKEKLEEAIDAIRINLKKYDNFDGKISDQKLLSFLTIKLQAEIIELKNNKKEDLNLEKKIKDSYDDNITLNDRLIKLTEKNNLLQKENNSIKEELIQIQNQIDVILELLNNL